MPGKRLTPADDAAIVALRRSGKSYALIAKLTGHTENTVMHVLHGRPTKRRKRKAPQVCEDCGSTTSKQYFREGGKLRCILCAGQARLKASGRVI